MWTLQNPHDDVQMSCIDNISLVACNMRLTMKVSVWCLHETEASLYDVKVRFLSRKMCVVMKETNVSEPNPWHERPTGIVKILL